MGDEACTPGAPSQEGVVPLTTIDVRGEQHSLIAYYAASVAVMFILFSMAGAGGALIGEEEGGTLERILNSNATMGTLLSSYFLFFVSLGVAQITLMFNFAALAFGLDLYTPNRIAGFAIVTVATASGAAAFGLVLATVCRSRAQLSGISTLVILLMSALGGSMVPRFVMPPIMNTISLFTFNGWALDGYLKVFWYDDPAAGLGAVVSAVLPQTAALFGLSGVCLLLARRFARRWESR
jgi:ABC-2 type transport system permease protein